MKFLPNPFFKSRLAFVIEVQEDEPEDDTLPTLKRNSILLGVEKLEHTTNFYYLVNGLTFCIRELKTKKELGKQ